MSDTKDAESVCSDVQLSGLDIPEFIPSIPSHLLTDCSEREKFILERISVLIQQNKWQMEMLKKYHDLRIENKTKFTQLFEYKLKEQLKQARWEGGKRWRYSFGVVLVLVAYPLYLALAAEVGLIEALKIF